MRQSEIEALGIRFVRVANEDLYRNDAESARGIHAIIEDESNKT